MGGSYIVTGAGGFIGARFVEAARREGAEIISVDDAATFARPEHAGIDFGKRIPIEELELFLSSPEAPHDLTAIIHLGACSDTMELDESVHERLNVAYSQMLWRWCTERGVSLMYASSAATYGSGDRGYDDDESLLVALEPLNPYGWSKQKVDVWALGEEEGGRTPPRWAGFKFFNVYGFGERHKGRMASVVMHSFDQIKASGGVRLFRSHKDGFANGEQKRDFVYVDDVVDVLLYAANTPAFRRGIYNLGSGNARTFVDLARATFAALEMPAKIEFIDMPAQLRERYQYFTEARMTRLREAGYTKPFTPLEDGVAQYVRRLSTHAAEAAR